MILHFTTLSCHGLTEGSLMLVFTEVVISSAAHQGICIFHQGKNVYQNHETQRQKWWPDCAGSLFTLLLVYTRLPFQATGHRAWMTGQHSSYPLKACTWTSSSSQIHVILGDLRPELTGSAWTSGTSFHSGTSSPLSATLP